MRYKYQSTLKDGNGKVIDAGTISVYLAGTTTAASVYAASSGGTAVNSVVTVNGYFSFWVDTDDYGRGQKFKVVSAKSGFLSSTFDDLEIFPKRLLVSEYATLAAAIAEIGSDNTTLVIDRDVSIVSDTVPSTLTLVFEAKITVTGTLTIYSPGNIQAASDQQVFAGAGTIAFTSKEGRLYLDYFSKNTTPGETNMTPAFTKAAVSAAGCYLGLNPVSYLTDSADFSATPPAYIDASGATIKARSVLADALVKIENPHSTIENFTAIFGLIDADSKAQHGLQIKGGQNLNILTRVKNATSHGVNLLALSGYGIYYSQFWLYSTYNAGDGIRMVTSDAANRIANNNFSGVAQNNLGNGWYSSYAQNTYLGCGAEKNNGYGFYSDNHFQNDFFGGYSENNYQNRAQEGSSVVSSVTSITRSGTTVTVEQTGHGYNVKDNINISGAVETEYNGSVTVVATPTNDTWTYTISTEPTTPATGTITANTLDTSFFLGASAARIKIIGGRHVGLISGTVTGAGKILLPSNAAFDGFYVDGDLVTSVPGALRLAGSAIAFGSTTAQTNSINFLNSADAYLKHGTTAYIGMIDATESIRFYKAVHQTIGNLPTGATPSVAGNNKFNTANVGATNVTTLADGINGQRVLIIGSDGGNTTFVDSAAFAIGGNITLADTDVIELIYNGSNWRRISNVVN